MSSDLNDLGFQGKAFSFSFESFLKFEIFFREKNVNYFLTMNVLDIIVETKFLNSRFRLSKKIGSIYREKLMFFVKLKVNSNTSCQCAV